ncbi:Pycsar system effector family protein [Streptomyces olivaceus]|uniref:Pycsar system effector family protein n=1 Tax=Streptomyces olivaceus TaxID=47716 RepID=UPI0035D6C5FB
MSSKLSGFAPRRRNWHSGPSSVTDATRSGVPSSFDPLDTAWRVHSVLVEWTGKADAKATFALTLQSTSLAIVAVLAGSGQVLSSSSRPAATVILIFGTVLLAGGAGLAIAAVSPNLFARNRGQPHTPGGSFLYFGDLRSWDPGVLETTLRESDPLPPLVRQLVVMSSIAWVKHRRVQWSLSCGATGVILVVIAASIRR